MKFMNLFKSNRSHGSSKKQPSSLTTVSKPQGYDLPASEFGLGYQFSKCSHDASKPIKIGGCEIWLGGGWHIQPEVLQAVDYIIPLNGQLPEKLPFGAWAIIYNLELPDFGGVPQSWELHVRNIAKLMGEGKKFLAYCTGSHGRTGTLAASLIAVMEPDTEDPIAAIRERHCDKAVESRSQMQAIFALKGVPVPSQYKSWQGKGGHGPASYGVTTVSHQPTLDQFPGIPAREDLTAILKAAFIDKTIDGWTYVHANNSISLFMDYSAPSKDRMGINPDMLWDTLAEIRKGNQNFDPNLMVY